jgi:hypothetical protein
MRQKMQPDKEKSKTREAPVTHEEQLMQQAGCDDPEWDYTKCRCENNGDYCTYCAAFYDLEIASERLEREHPETI